MRPTTAVIMAAGVGSRMLPVTSAVPKELLPILTRPVIDYIVADMVAGGITRIIFVIRPGQTALKDYYLGNPELDQTLTRLKKTEALAMLQTVRGQAQFEFVEQPDDSGYGSAVPLRTVLPLLNPDEPVLVSSSDDVVWNADGSSETKQYIEAFVESGAEGALMTLTQDKPGASYGVVKTIQKGTSQYLESITENVVQVEGAPALVNISKYILSGGLREIVTSITPRPENGEFYITDVLVNGSKTHAVMVYQASGTYLDAGNPVSWLEANNIVAAASKPGN